MKRAITVFKSLVIAARRRRRYKTDLKYQEVARARSAKFYEDNRETILAKEKQTKGPRRNPWDIPGYREHMSNVHKGKPGYWTGRSLTKETKAKLSEVHKEHPTRYWLNKKCPHVAGQNNPGYIDGRHPEHKRQRHSMEYERWRRQVFERDNWTCQHCGTRGGRLNANHIKPFATHPELRFEVSNGETLCVPCHRKTPTWGRKALTA